MPAKRAFMDGYQHYDTADGFGRPSEWQHAAESLASGLGIRTDDRGLSAADRADLAALGLVALPGEVSALKSAFRTQAFTAHPDYGGTDAAFKRVFAAYE